MLGSIQKIETNIHPIAGNVREQKERNLFLTFITYAKRSGVSS